MYIEIKIAVQPLVKAYLKKNYNIEPFDLKQDNQYGIFLHNCLSPVKKVLTLKRSPILDINTEKYTEVLTLRLSERAWRRQGSFISAEKQRGFNKMVLLDLSEKLYLYVDSRTCSGQVTLTQAFLEFREKFDLQEENLTLKSMEKKYERYRSDLNNCKSA
jgi:hypothetical protein